MEGQLKGGHHCVEIASDVSNLEEKQAYYAKHPKECQDIAEAANAYCHPFMDAPREDLRSLLGLQKYFALSKS